jgi:hypothetical protein
MKLFIIILLINCAYLFGERLHKYQFGERLYKYQLRGMHKQMLDELYDEAIQNKFVSIYDKIMERAIDGINEYSFTIMCEQSSDMYDKSIYSLEECDRVHNGYNGYKRWIQNHPNNIVSITKSYITREVFATNIIDMLNYSFPDSKISKLHKNCCDYYQIEW